MCSLEAEDLETDQDLASFLKAWKGTRRLCRAPKKHGDPQYLTSSPSGPTFHDSGYETELEEPPPTTHDGIKGKDRISILLHAVRVSVVPARQTLRNGQVKRNLRLPHPGDRKLNERYEEVGLWKVD